MFKENGRVSPASSKETASVRSRNLSCPKCGKTFRVEISKISFGEKIGCPDCGCELTEDSE